MPFKVYCKPYKYSLNGGTGEFANLYGPNRKRRGVYIKIENLKTRNFGIGEAPVPFYFSRTQSSDALQEEMDLVVDLVSAVRAEKDSFHLPEPSSVERLNSYYVKKTEMWVDAVCRRLKSWSLAVRSALIEAVMCASFSLWTQEECGEELRQRYDAYYVQVTRLNTEIAKYTDNARVGEYPVIPKVVPIRALELSDWVETRDWWWLHHGISASLSMGDDGSAAFEKFMKDERKAGKTVFDRPSLFTTDSNQYCLTVGSLSLQGTWETGVGLAHLALTAAHVGTRFRGTPHAIVAFPRKYTGDTFAERITARFIEECVKSKSEVPASVSCRCTLKCRCVLQIGQAASFVDIEACGKLLKSADPFAEDADPSEDSAGEKPSTNGSSVVKGRKRSRDRRENERNSKRRARYSVES